MEKPKVVKIHLRDMIFLPEQHGGCVQWQDLQLLVYIYSNIYLKVCLLTYLCVCMHMHVYKLQHACRGQRTTNRSWFSLSSMRDPPGDQT